MTTATGPTADLARFASGLTFDVIPPEAVQRLKLVLLDTIGVALAATSIKSVYEPLISAARAMGPARQATVLGSAERAGLPAAALVNGGLAHALNYDCVGTGGHPGATTVPAALAVAESRRNVHGREFLAAMAAGVEVQSRIALAATAGGREKPDRTVLRGQLYGYFGAAVSAGRVLGLSPGEMTSVITLAAMQAAGIRHVVVGGDRPAKSIYAAFPNQAGVTAAQLARSGLDAGYAALEGSAGFYSAFFPDSFTPAPLAEPGMNFVSIEEIQFKRWPVSAMCDPYIGAALRIVSSNRLRPADIRSVLVRGGPEIAPWCDPLPERRAPANHAAAGDSIIFAVAKTLANGRLGLGDLTDKGLSQPEALAIGGRTSYEVVEDDRTEAVLVVTTINGERLAPPLSKSRLPAMSDGEVIAKFVECAQSARPSVPVTRIEKLVSEVLHLEDIEDISGIPALTRGGRAG